MSNLGEYVRRAARIPTEGPPYVRCVECKRQLYGAALGGSAKRYQIYYVLRHVLERHLTEEHGE